jgi:Trypsin-like peptidase domain
MDGASGAAEIMLASGHKPSDYAIHVDTISQLAVSPFARTGTKARSPAACPNDATTPGGAVGIGCSESCNLDFACVDQPAALQAIGRATVRIDFVDDSSGPGFVGSCTGTLLNSNPVTLRPYIYTAAHCIDSQTEAASAETYWFYDSVACNSLSTPPFQRITTGTSLRVVDQNMDVTLIEMRDPPPNGAVFAAWDATIVPTNAGSDRTILVGVHHPSGDLKAVSEGRMQGYVSGTQLSENYIQVRWSANKGTTEGGSSGSGIFTFNPNCGDGNACYQLRGGLEGGQASCSNPSAPDRYSRMDLLFTRLAPYLYPSKIIPANDSATNVVMEFFNPVFDYYFQTSRTGEKAALADFRDSRGSLEWYPTGYWYNLDATASPSTNSLTRYFLPAVARRGARGSHFYTALNGEKQGISATGTERFSPNCGGIPNGWFCNESTEGYVFPIIGSGLSATCAAGERKIWRVFRAAPADDGNHRYVTSQEMYDYMRFTLGWNGENVNLCVRP